MSGPEDNPADEELPTKEAWEKAIEPEPAKCCKCAAYREIVAENALEIARLKAALEKAADWSKYLIGDLNKSLGIKP